MIDLRKKFEELKCNSSIKDCLLLFEDYNIITAPKEIKLSEIVSKLKEINPKYYFNKKAYAIGLGNFDVPWEWVGIIYFFNEKKIMKINKINYPYKENTKWLYTLWIAGTTIIDDLKGNE